MSSFHDSVPCSFTSSAPMLFFGCHTHDIAPVGSAITAIRPASMTSNGGAMTEPPAPGTCAAVASTSVTVTYEFQCGGTPGIGRGATAATAFPFFKAIEYTPSLPESSGPTGCTSWFQPH